MEHRLFSSVLALINDRAREFIHLEVDIHSYSANNLTLLVGEDLLYYGDFKVVFEDVFSLSINASFRINTALPLLVMASKEEVYELNRRFRVERGNTIFKLQSEDGIVFFIAAKSIQYLPEVEKLVY
ncbi:MAG: hypothetical protein ACRYGH_12040 [Janthinobacterium lividum]